MLGERDALSRLLPLACSSAEVSTLHDRLAAACEKTGDVAGAARSAAPTPERLAVELRLARAAGDHVALVSLLPEAAQGAAALAALAEAHVAAPEVTEMLRAQVDLAERTGDVLLALGALRALLAGVPSDAPALELRGARAALAAGELATARDHAARAEGAGAAGAAEIQIDVLGRTGQRFIRIGASEATNRAAALTAVVETAGVMLLAPTVHLASIASARASASFGSGR